MTDEVTPLRRDFAFWSSICRTAVQAIAAAAITTDHYWDAKGQKHQLLYGAAAVIALLLVSEPIRERRKAKKAAYSTRQSELVGAALARLLAEVQHHLHADISAITAHVHRVEHRWFWTKPQDLKLKRLARLSFNDSYAPTDIEFHPSKGVIGVCLETKAAASVLMTRRTLDANTADEWELVPEDERLNLTWSDQLQLRDRRYGGVIAEPVKDNAGAMVAVVSLGVETGLESNLQTGLIRKAMGTAAIDVSRAMQQ